MAFYEYRLRCPDCELRGAGSIVHDNEKAARSFLNWCVRCRANNCDVQILRRSDDAPECSVTTDRA